MDGEKIKLTADMVSFINSWNRVKFGRNSDWLYIPFWFKKTENEDVFEVYSFDRLPTEVTEYMQYIRKSLVDNPDKPNPRTYPLLITDVSEKPVEKVKRVRKAVAKYEPIKKDL